MATDWYDVIDLPHGIRAIRERLREGTDVSSFLVEGEHTAAVIDTGTGVGDFEHLVTFLTSLPVMLLQSHAHWDHIGSSYRFKDVRVHPADADDLRAGEANAGYVKHFGPGGILHEWLPQGFEPSLASIPGCEPHGWLNDGDQIDLGGRALEVIHTPGHSPGGVAFLDRAARILIPGDTLKIGAILLMLDGSDPVAYRATLRRLVGILDAIDSIYPSHGEPMVPDDVRALHEAYERVWSGHVASAPELAPPAYSGDHDVYVVDRFTFLMPKGTIAS
jgi:glyoxylase-like metal-dependent hydrolase (beta-lactamase superfamily II)